LKAIVKNIIILISIGAMVFAIGNFLYDDFSFGSTKQLIINFSIYQLYTFVLGFSNMAFFQYLERVNWKSSESVKRIVIGIVGSVTITLFGLFFLR